MTKIDTSIYTDVIGRSNATFQNFIGQRGVGKTYSCLKYYGITRPIDCGYDENKKFIFMRRTEAEIKKVVGEPKSGRSPFRKINMNEGTTITCEYKSSDSFGYIWNNEDRDKVIGYIAALSTFAGIRGADFSDVDTIIIDEVVPEEHITTRANLGDAFLHMIETVNRNREFEGMDSVRVYCFANSIKIANDVFAAQNIVGDIAEMAVNGEISRYKKKEDVYIEIIKNERFTAAKAQTKLYKMSHDTDFERQALLNMFTNDDLRTVKQIKLTEYRPLFQFGDFAFYEHKTGRDLYIIKKDIKVKDKFTLLDRDTVYWRFAASYRLAKYAKAVFYDSYSTKVAVDSLLTKRI